MYRNVALNRPTFASSVGSGGDYSPSNAVDNNFDTDAQSGNSCFLSDTEANPWWAVDLGAALTVVGLFLVNRGDAGNVGLSALCVNKTIHYTFLPVKPKSYPPALLALTLKLTQTLTVTLTVIIFY